MGYVVAYVEVLLCMFYINRFITFNCGNLWCVKFVVVLEVILTYVVIFFYCYYYVV